MEHGTGLHPEIILTPMDHTYLHHGMLLLLVPGNLRRLHRSKNNHRKFSVIRFFTVLNRMAD